MLFSKIEGRMRIVTYSDAAFRNLPDKISSRGGHIVFFTSEKEKEAATMAWSR